MRKSVLIGGLLLLALRTTTAAEPFELKDGDRVVLLGSTIIEQAQRNGQIETLLTRRWPDRDITFRNLGWSGDEVSGIARARFGPVEEGFQHLKQHVEELEPTVLLVSYGTNESFRGAEGLSAFREGLNHLLDVLDATKARIVLISPNRLEDLGRPLPDPADHNRDLQAYVDLLHETAESRGYGFVDLYDSLPDGTRSSPPRPLTNDGMHLTDYGYWRAGQVIEHMLGLPALNWKVSLGKSDVQAEGSRISLVRRTDDGVRFRSLDSVLPPPPAPSGVPEALAAPTAERTLRVEGLAPGSYVLKVDGQPVGEGEAADWAEGVRLKAGPEFDQVERLRQTIVTKNRLYFYRWRPQNETYLYGFRKHEQGQNAREVPLFDPLVEEQERQIAGLRRPVPHTYELIRAESENEGKTEEAGQ